MNANDGFNRRPAGPRAGHDALRRLLEDMTISTGCAVQINVDSTGHGEGRYPIHAHPFHELIFCESGRTDYLLGGRLHHVEPGDILFIPPGVNHGPLLSGAGAGTEPFARYALWIDPGFLESLLKSHPDVGYAFDRCDRLDSRLLRTPEVTWRPLGGIFASIRREQEQRLFGWQACLESSAVMLLAHLSRTYRNRDVQAPAPDAAGLMDAVHAYIDRNLTRSLTLREVAGAFSVSESTLSHMFQRRVGVSFHQCVVQRRLLAAKTNMLAGEPPTSAWRGSGFGDYTTFYRQFRKWYGMTPSQFAKAARDGGGER